MRVEIPTETEWLRRKTHNPPERSSAVENAIAAVEMPTDTPGAFTQTRIFADSRLFDSVTSQTVGFASSLALRMLSD